MTNFSTQILSELKSQVQNQLAAHEKELLPCFYTVTGSHLYEINNSSSDIDIKGFHCANGSRYMTFETPESQLSFEASTTAVNASIEITSYELKKFGEMLLKSDFSIIELIGADIDVYTQNKTLLQGIEDTLAETWPAELPARYLGMADWIYREEIKETIATEPSDLKPYAYALRGCLAAEYVQKHEKIEPRLQSLAEHILVGEQYKQTQTFIDSVRNDQLPNKDVLEMVQSVITKKLDIVEASQFDREQRARYKNGVADWMLAVRRQTSTR